MEFTLSKDDHIKFIIDNFDFDKVVRIMEVLDWKWFTTTGTKIPSESELKKEAIAMLNNIYFSDDDSISTGGLKASKYDDYLELEFILEDGSSEILNYGDKYEKMKKLKNRRNKINNIEKIENGINN